MAGGEPRERQALLLAVASVLTKDQAAAAWILPLPVVLVVVPRVAGGKDALRPRLVGAVLLAVGVYAVVSGAATNPFGFARRVRIDVLHAGASWAAYPPDLSGRLALARDALLSTPRFTSWPIALAAGVGLAAAFLAVRVQGSHDGVRRAMPDGLLGIAVTQGRGLERARALLPLLAALSFTIFFNFGARRSDERFLLPQSVFFFPYAALAFETAMRRWPRSRSLVLAAAASALAPALLGVASMDATLLADARYEAERVLAALPAGTHVEVYGSAIFLPRIPPQLVAVRPGVEPFATRQPISGIRDIIDPAMESAAAGARGDRPRDGVQPGLCHPAAGAGPVRRDAVHRRPEHSPVPRPPRWLARLHPDAKGSLFAPASPRVPEHPRRHGRRGLDLRALRIAEAL